VSRRGTAPRDSAPRGTQLDVKVLFAPALPTVRLRGELRPATVHLVREALMAVAARRGMGPLIVLDLSGVTRCDQVSLRAVHESVYFLTAAGKELTIQGSPACVLELLE
jgi:anti-anti-sigma regulatory factor